MRSLIKNSVLVAMLMALCTMTFAQGYFEPLQNYRSPGHDGLNVFEVKDSTEYTGFRVHVGGDFALQFQAIDHEADLDGTPYMLRYLAPSVNLPTANLNLDAQLYDGIRVHLRTYLSSRHHNESWVKGGYLQIDRLAFIKEGFLSRVMDILSIKAGVDNFAYGDAVYRRTDNAAAIYNPFVGNYLMDANTVEPFLEFYLYPCNFILVGGISTGILNPTVVRSEEDQKMPPTLHGKVGYDNQFNENLRVRLTASMYVSTSYNNGRYLFGGDRAGSRYYHIFDYIDTSDLSANTNDFAGRVNPRFNKQIAFVVNPFIKFHGLEFFGLYEVNTGYSNEGEEDADLKRGIYTQLGVELLYRFGGCEQFYFGGRYNRVCGNGAYDPDGEEPEKMTVYRINIGGGWFMTENILVKLEFVRQQYNDQWSGVLKDGMFQGGNVEAVISF